MTPEQRRATPALLDHLLTLDSRGDWHVVGQIRNDTPDNLELVRIDGLFYDGALVPLAQAYTYAYIDILRPGETAPFRLSLTQELPRPVASYALQVGATRTREQPFLGIQFVQHDAQLQGGEGEGDPASLTLIGEVTNVNHTPASEVHVACALYDEEGHIVDVGMTYAEVDVLESEEKAPFRVWIAEIQGRPVDYHLLAYGQEAEDYQIQRRAQVEVLGVRAYESEFGGWVLIGEVQNVDPFTARFVQVAASFYDPEDRLIAVDATFGWRSVLDPQHRSPFQIELYDPPPDIDHWRLWARGSRTQEPAQDQLILEEVQNAVGPDDVVTFTGVVRNRSPSTMEKIEVGATIYGPDQEIAAAKRIWIEVALGPDATTPFELQVQAPLTASSYTLYAEGEIVE